MWTSLPPPPLSVRNLSFFPLFFHIFPFFIHTNFICLFPFCVISHFLAFLFHFLFTFTFSSLLIYPLSFCFVFLSSIIRLLRFFCLLLSSYPVLSVISCFFLFFFLLPSSHSFFPSSFFSFSPISVYPFLKKKSTFYFSFFMPFLSAFSTLIFIIYLNCSFLLP